MILMGHARRLPWLVPWLAIRKGPAMATEVERCETTSTIASTMP